MDNAETPIVRQLDASLPFHFLSLPYIDSLSLTHTMDSIIETQRQSHEELERYEQALAEVLLQNPSAVSPHSDFPVRHAYKLATKYRQAG
jgi:hypothetical protein